MISFKSSEIIKVKTSGAVSIERMIGETMNTTVNPAEIITALEIFLQLPLVSSENPRAASYPPITLKSIPIDASTIEIDPGTRAVPDLLRTYGEKTTSVKLLCGFARNA